LPLHLAENLRVKIFISSPIDALKSERSAARQAVIDLGHEPIMAEEFQAQPRSSQIACLDGVRQSAAVVLLLGSSYGVPLPSGLSATHEEYREARAVGRPVFAFAEEIERDSDQQAFVREAGQWQTGLYWQKFRTPEELRSKIVRALHEWTVSSATAPLDAQELLKRARENVTEDGYQRQGFGPLLVLSIAAGPTQPVLRPSELENPKLAKDIQKEAMFGDLPIFNAKAGSHTEMADDFLVVAQERGPLVRLDTQGTIILQLAVPQDDHGMSIIEEGVAAAITAGLAYAAWLLDRIDQTQRLSHVVIVASMQEIGFASWKTRSEHQASPNRSFMRTNNQPVTVHLTPPHRVRSALTSDGTGLTADIITLLHRQLRV
jgi:hypothetical protein